MRWRTRLAGLAVVLAACSSDPASPTRSADSEVASASSIQTAGAAAERSPDDGPFTLLISQEHGLDSHSYVPNLHHFSDAGALSTMAWSTAGGGTTVCLEPEPPEQEGRWKEQLHVLAGNPLWGLRVEISFGGCDSVWRAHGNPPARWETLRAVWRPSPEPVEAADPDDPAEAVFGATVEHSFHVRFADDVDLDPAALEPAMGSPFDEDRILLRLTHHPGLRISSWRSWSDEQTPAQACLDAAGGVGETNAEAMAEWLLEHPEIVRVVRGVAACPSL